MPRSSPVPAAGPLLVLAGALLACATGAVRIPPEHYVRHEDRGRTVGVPPEWRLTWPADGSAVIATEDGAIAVSVQATLFEGALTPDPDAAVQRYLAAQGLRGTTLSQATADGHIHCGSQLEPGGNVMGVCLRVDERLRRTGKVVSAIEVAATEEIFASAGGLQLAADILAGAQGFRSLQEP